MKASTSAIRLMPVVLLEMLKHLSSETLFIKYAEHPLTPVHLIKTLTDQDALLNSHYQSVLTLRKLDFKMLFIRLTKVIKLLALLPHTMKDFISILVFISLVKEVVRPLWISVSYSMPMRSRILRLKDSP
jgi:hypothetical protein